jgi:hypothetical protein
LQDFAHADDGGGTHGARRGGQEGTGGGGGGECEGWQEVVGWRGALL